MLFPYSRSLCLLAVCVYAVATSASIPTLSVKTHGGPSIVTDPASIKIITRVVNTGNHSVVLLNTPKSLLTSVPTDKFRISHESGATPTFIGVKPKDAEGGLASVTKGPVTVLTPGQSFEVIHDLSKAYNFTMNGGYTIVPSNQFYAASPTHSTIPIYAEVEAFTIKLARQVLGHRDIDRCPKPSFANCSASQQAFLLQATKYAESYARQAYEYLQHGVATPRYTTWFGAYDRSRFNIVKGHFRRISTAPNFFSFRYDCSCTREGTWGYVIPDEFGVVYLCPTFWTLPIHGKESMAGSLVQKSSHFTRNGGVLDFVYTQPLCKELAIRNASQAIFNADSYEYFAENDPTID